jgi:hypothetical protein
MKNKGHSIRRALRKAGQAGSPTQDDKSDFTVDGIRFLEMFGAD